jgi:hypothetical protein
MQLPWCEDSCMANTRDLEAAFDWTRKELGKRFDVTFSKAQTTLRQGTQRTFNAVSNDGSIVATISHSSGLTSGNKKPVGKIHGAVAYLYFLSQARAQRRMLVLTDPDLHRFVLNEVEGAVGDGLEILHVPLPSELAAKVRAVTSRASDEMSA